MFWLLPNKNNMISKKEVQHIAKLARLGLTQKEEEKFSGELSSILDYIEKLKKVDVAKEKATFHPFSVQNVFRKDEASEKKYDLLSSAPAEKDGYIKVKSILK